jgi:phosphatidylserine decarboxylase
MKIYLINLSACIFISVGLIYLLAYRWQLRRWQILRLLPVVSIFSSIINSVVIYIFQIESPVGIIFGDLIAVGLTTIAALLACFYHDPEREAPMKENVILSPADGEVIYIKKIEQGEIPVSVKKSRRMKLTELTKTDLLAEGGYLVGIAMNVMNVHVNRAPIQGTVRLIKHFKGKFLSLRRAEAVSENESTTTIIENGNLSIGVVQIASRLVRRIASYVKENDPVALGQRFGMIKFGSQVDVVLPNRPDIQICLKPKDEVRAGISILATYRTSTKNDI